jgi:hypothetical protein
MLDLAEDGRFGQATVDLPFALTKTALTTPHHCGSSQVDFRHEYAPANLREPVSQNIFQPVTFGVQPTLKIIDYRNTRSSGGIPLLRPLLARSVLLGSQNFLIQ